MVLFKPTSEGRKGVVKCGVSKMCTCGCRMLREVRRIDDGERRISGESIVASEKLSGHPMHAFPCKHAMHAMAKVANLSHSSLSCIMPHHSSPHNYK